MSRARKSDVGSLGLNARLEAYFATRRLQPSRQPSHWQLYAAATGSAMAMLTGASASIVGSAIRVASPDAVQNFLASRQQFAASQNTPVFKAVKMAMARQDASRVRAHATKTPAIARNGVVPLYSTVNVIQPGEWVSIYGDNLAAATAMWKGDFPTNLGGVTVTVNGKAGYLSYVSPKQINFQAPDDAARGLVSVVVTNGAGKASSTVTLNAVSPSFDLIDSKHIAGIILRSNGSGAYGDGAYDILGPTGSCLGYHTVAAQTGDVVALFGLGFGPTTPTVQSGKPFSGAAPISSPFTLYVNNVSVQPTFVGLSSAGLYQVNLVVPPGIGAGDVPVVAMVDGMQTQPGVMFSLPFSDSSPGVSACGYSGTGGAPTGGGGTNFGPTGGSGGGTGWGPTGGGTGGGSGGGGGGGGGTSGGSARLLHHGRPYEPRLRFPSS